jgi:hypothetical protein
LTDENFKILSTYQSKIKHEPLIPLGTRGKVRGETFEVIGYMRRQIEVEGIPYEWSEYLLFNPYKGFRWLTEYNGHWNFVRTATSLPKVVNLGGKSAVNYIGTNFFHYQASEARVSYVLGEFYWRVQVGEVCQVVDYVAPPLMLSKETTEAEETWSLGEYIEPNILWQGFQLKTSPPLRVGVAPNQPSPLGGSTSKMWKLFGCFLLAAILLQLFFGVFAQNRLVFHNDFIFDKTAPEKSLVTDVFELTGHDSNVVIKSKAAVNNSWIFLNMALINEETEKAYDFGREISYYSGVDGGESWSEGSRSDEAVLPTIPAGHYYLRIEPESESSSMPYKVEVYRDVPSWTYFFIAISILTVFPFFQWARRRQFEAARWSDSDHPMGSRSGSSSSSEDD